jgi:hypothetical protein
LRSTKELLWSASSIALPRLRIPTSIVFFLPIL